MKIAVTGSQGFIGTYICQELLKRGHKVIGFDKKGRPKLSFRCVDQNTGEDISDRIANKPAMVDERESGDRDDRRGAPRRDDRREDRPQRKHYTDDRPFAARERSRSFDDRRDDRPRFDRDDRTRLRDWTWCLDRERGAWRKRDEG